MSSTRKYIEKRIKDDEQTSPCQAALYSLLRFGEKGWLPSDGGASCQAIMAKMKNNFSGDVLNCKEIAKQYPDFLRCKIGASMVFSMKRFGQYPVEKMANTAGKELSEWEELLKQCDANFGLNLWQSYKCKQLVKDTKEIAKDFYQFRRLHFLCRSESSSDSLNKAKKEISEQVGVHLK